MNNDQHEQLNEIIVDTYGAGAEYLAGHILKRIDEGSICTKRDLMLCLWMGYGGGTTADATAEKIVASMPSLVIDSEERTH